MMHAARSALLLVAFYVLTAAATARRVRVGRLATRGRALPPAGTSTNLAVGNRGNHRLANGVREEN